jgi:hypothetical protein
LIHYFLFNRYFRTALKNHTVAKRVITLALALLFMCAASVKEVHFLFATHAEAHQDSCNNHLHSGQDEHGHCNVCNFDMAVTDGYFYQPCTGRQFFSLTDIIHTSVSYLYSTTPAGYHLRGPPAC